MNLAFLQNCSYIECIRDGTDQDFLDPIGKFQNLRRLIGFWPARSTAFFTEGFCSLFNASSQKFLKRGTMGKGLNLWLRTGVSEKHGEKFLRLNFKTFMG